MYGKNLLHHTLLYYIYIQRKIFFRATIFLYSPCHYMRAWIRVLDAPGCYEKVCTTRLRIGQNCRAVCTKSSASGHSYVQLARDTRCIVKRSAQKRRAPAKQALAIVTEPQAKREARSVACSLSYLSVVRKQHSSRARMSPLHTYT